MYNFFIPCMWSIFFFFVITIFIIDHIRYKQILSDSYVYKFSIYDFSWFFLSVLFIVLFWFCLYVKQGIMIANFHITNLITGYLLELLLSMDHVFIWFFIFQYFSIPAIYQRKILLYGALGAIILRFVMIFFGKILFLHWHWLLYFFGLFFLFTGFRVIFFNKQQEKQEKIIQFPFLSRLFRITKNLHNEKFFIMQNNKLFITPLFLCLIIIELSDIIFAMDGIPAIFAITKNSFVIYSVNILSVLGLRSIYFLILHFVNQVSMIKYSFAMILILLGFKILFDKYFFISNIMTSEIIVIILFSTIILHYILYYIKNKK